MKRIALICFDNPFVKPMEGGKRGMLSRIQALASCDEYDVDVFLLTKPSEVNNERNNKISAINLHYFEYIIQKDFNVILSKYPISVAKRFIKECANDLRKRKYDVAIYEGEHVSTYRINNCVNAKKHILYMHDIESEYRNDIAKSETNKIRALAQKAEAKKYFNLEEKIASIFDEFMFVSIDEKKSFERRFPSTVGRCFYTPYATNGFASSIVRNNNNNQILYIGNLKLKNNYLSILWFAKSVFPIILGKQKAKLLVVGNISDENKRELLEISNCIEVDGYVQDLNAVINKSCLIISPVLYGAGVKVKLIDALSSGQIVVANKKATEGTELEAGRHLIIADNPNSFAQACINILQNRNKYEIVAQQGLDFVRKEHSVEHHKELLVKIIEQ